MDSLLSRQQLQLVALDIPLLAGAAAILQFLPDLLTYLPETVFLLVLYIEIAAQMRILGFVLATAFVEGAVVDSALLVAVLRLVADQSFVLGRLQDDPCWYTTYTATLHTR